VQLAARAPAGVYSGPDAAWVRAAPHLARRHAGRVEAIPEDEQVGDGVERETERGYRAAREVLAYLRSRGAKIATLERQIEGSWGALSSGDDTPAATDTEEPVWVPAGKH
jgi:glycerol-3-phosphate O-acyltransferase/dihydroxyacetone phosphate acyltransferase